MTSVTVTVSKSTVTPDDPSSVTVTESINSVTTEDGASVTVTQSSNAVSVTPPDETTVEVGSQAVSVVEIGGGGSGTVTTVSVTTANGVSGSVANPTTTPAITLTLGAITPSSVAATGNVSGANLSGTNTGDQTNISGNAATATQLQTARLIGNVPFDGTDDITPTHHVAERGGDDATDNYPLFFSGATGLPQSLFYNTSFYYDGLAGQLTAPSFLGNLTGNADTATTAGTVTTNANLTGPVTSVGNATAIADGALSIAKTSGLQTALNLKAPLTSPTFATSITGSYLTASQILITDASKNIVSGAVATYPSLTEVSYVKGVTSAIQTQLNGKQAIITTGATDNAILRADGTGGSTLQNSGVLIDDSNNVSTAGKMSVGTVTTAVTDSRSTIGVQSTTEKGFVVQMPSGSTVPAFEIQASTGAPAAKFATTGNGRLVLNYSGTMAAAAYPGFVLSVQNIGDSGEGSWIEILNSGGANTGAFFGMIGNQFQLFNWQGGDTEFWTFPSASNGYPRYTISKEGNFAFDGTDQFGWSGGYGGGVGVLAVRNAKTVPSSGVSNVAMLYSESGEMYTMSSDAVKTRLSNKVIALTDGATPALNAKLGDVFTLSAAGDRTIAIPTNPTSGQRIVIRHTASGANRTLALNTGAGGFRFGTTITGLTVTTSGLTDYIECLYNATASKWDVISYVKGF